MSQTPIPITGGSGTSSVAAELIAGTSFQQIEVYGGGGASVLSVNPDGSIKASIIGTPTVIVTGLQGSSVSGTVGASIIGTVPVTFASTANQSVSGTVTTQYAPTASLVSAVTSIITTTSQTSVLATAPGAQRNYVTQMLITNAGVTGTQVNIMDGPNVVYAGYAAASGGGFALTFPAPFKQATLAQSLDVKAVTTTSITAAMSGYTAA